MHLPSSPCLVIAYLPIPSDDGRLQHHVPYRGAWDPDLGVLPTGLDDLARYLGTLGTIHLSRMGKGKGEGEMSVREDQNPDRVDSS